MSKRYWQSFGLVQTEYRSWLSDIDRRLGADARADLAHSFDWLGAWEQGLSPSEAIIEACECLIAN
jgi:hypothetical protein